MKQLISHPARCSPVPSIVLCVAVVFAVGCGRNGDSGGSENVASGKTAGKGGKGGKGGKAGKAGDKSGKGKVKQAPSRGPEHSVYSLVDNRLSSHRLRAGGFVADAGSAGFVRYLRFGRSKLPWETRGKKEDTPIATMGGKVSGVTVPLTAAQASGAVRVRGFSTVDQRLGLRINGKQKQEVTTQVTAGWFTAELAAPDGTLKRGENELLFFAGSKPLEVAWIQVGGDAGAERLPPIYDGAASALVLAKDNGLAYYVQVPDKGRVTGDVVGDGCSVEVRAVPESGEAVKGALEGNGAAVDLAALAGKPVRLELEARGCDEAKLTGAALVVPGKAAEKAPLKKPRHVVLWVMDSLRADKVSVFVPGARAEVPVMTSLVEDSTAFTQTYVQGNETKCSHASIWTALYPVRHKMIPPNSKLSHKWNTIDEVAKKAGLFTSGVSGNGYITPKRGFGQKWDKYRNHIHEGGGLKAENILEKGIASLAGKEKDPWLLYLGTIDTHVSWRAKEPWFSRYDDKPYTGRFSRQASGGDVGKVAAGAIKLSDRDLFRIKALYDSNVSYQDQQVGELIKWLKDQGIYEDTAIIITADHGDELMEVGRIGHGSSLRSSLVHVPLLIHYPPMFKPGQVSEGAEVVDIVPTVAELLGVEHDKEWQGESLVGLGQGVGRGYPRMSMASLYENAHVGQIGPWKLRAARGSVKFYDMRDPTEKKEVSEQHPFALRMVADSLWMLRAYNDQWRKAAWGNPANVTDKFAAAMGE